MKVAFLGTGGFALPILQALENSKHVLTGVVTGPDKPAGRGRHLIPTPIRVYADSKGIPVETPVRLKDPEFISRYSAWRPDVAVVVAFRILPKVIFDIPKYGTLNIHPSKLPQYRGPAPIPWAIIDGAEETAISIFRVTENVDAGNLLMQKPILIHPEETAGELIDRISPISADLLLQTLDLLEQDRLKAIAQDNNLATSAPKLVKEDGLIKWDQPAIVVHNRVRGVNPWPGAYTYLNGKLLKLYKSQLGEGKGVPGEILSSLGKLEIACGSGSILFEEVQREGKKRMSIAEFMRGLQISSKTILGE